MYTYRLERNDFVHSLLYAASQSKQVFRARVRRWFIFSAVFLGLGMILLGKDPYTGRFFIIVGILYLAFYPFYSRWYYKRLYTRRVGENFKSRIGVTIQLDIQASFLATYDPTGETRIGTSEIDRITDIGKILLIRTQTGPTLIIPAHAPDYQTIRTQIQNIARQKNIPWYDKSYWKWR